MEKKPNTLKEVESRAVEDPEFFAELIGDPEAALKKRNLALSEADLARLKRGLGTGDEVALDKEDLQAILKGLGAGKGPPKLARRWRRRWPK